MSSFDLSENISYTLISNENTSSGKESTPVKATLLPGQARVIVVASLPTNPSCDVTLKIKYVIAEDLPNSSLSNSEIPYSFMYVDHVNSEVHGYLL